MGEATDKLGRFLDFRDQAVKADELRDNRRAIRERQRQGGEVAETESQPRQISRRQFLKGAGLTAAAIVGGAGVYKLVRTTMDTFQSIQSEPSIAGSETKANALAQETTKENITPYRFLPGKTTIDLTKVHLRTSPQVLDEMQGRNNNIDLSKIKSIEGITLIGNEKTMYVENAMLEEAYDANGNDWMISNIIGTGPFQAVDHKLHDRFGQPEPLRLADEAKDCGKVVFLPHG